MKKEAYSGVVRAVAETRLSEQEMDEAVEAALKKLRQFTVALGDHLGEDMKRWSDTKRFCPGSGVIVEGPLGRFGILTAAHVLRGRSDAPRTDTRERRSSLGIIPTQPAIGTKHGYVPCLSILNRRCIVEGINNEGFQGPDLAYVPLRETEWRFFERHGSVAYNSQRTDRRIQEDGQYRVMDAAFGVRTRAIDVLGRESPRPGLLYVLTQTIERAEKRRTHGGWDYTEYELKSDAERPSMPFEAETKAEEELARKALSAVDLGEPIDVKWGGYSGSGLWTVALLERKGTLTGEGSCQLKGIAFFARECGTMIAHGQQSLERILTRAPEAHGWLAEQVLKIGTGNSDRMN